LLLHKNSEGVMGGRGANGKGWRVEGCVRADVHQIQRIVSSIHKASAVDESATNPPPQPAAHHKIHGYYKQGQQARPVAVRCAVAAKWGGAAPAQCNEMIAAVVMVVVGCGVVQSESMPMEHASSVEWQAGRTHRDANDDEETPLPSFSPSCLKLDRLRYCATSLAVGATFFAGLAPACSVCGVRQNAW
jgi:hypothetical protein